MHKKSDFLRTYGFLLIPFLFYSFTVCRTVGFGDTALLINDMERFGATSHVNNHPLTVLTGSLFIRILPFQELAHRANMVSVFYGSLTVACFYLLLLFEFGALPTAVVGSLFLMLCHSLWWHSTVVENYAATAFLTTVCLYCWRRLARSDDRRWLLALCFFAGLGLFNHVQMGFVCLGVAVTGVLYARRNSAWWPTLPLCGVAAAAGMTPWLILLARDLAKSNSLRATLHSAFVGNFSGTFFSGALWQSLYDTVFVFWFQSPTLYLVGFGLAGICLCFRNLQGRPVFWGMLTPLVINSANFAMYPTWDKFAFLLESFVLLYFFAGVALNALFQATRGNPLRRGALFAYLVISLLIGPFLYTNISTWALDPRSVWHRRYNNRYSANAYFHSDFIVNPNKRNFDDVQKFARLLFERLPRDAVFLDSDSRTYYTLADYYQRISKVRSDVSLLLVNSWGIANWGLESGALADMMTRAYYLDKPFFAISNQKPIAAFIRKAQEKEPEIELVKFPLNEKRWIYRLITQREKDEKRRIELESLEWFRPIGVFAPRGYHDLDTRDVGYVNTGNATRQDMSSYDGQWHSRDQLFFRGEKPGAGVEFYLKTAESRMVDLTLWMTAAPDYGKVRIELLPARASAEGDLFDDSVKPAQLRLSGVSLVQGINRLVISVVGNAPRSSGFHFGIDGIEYTTVRKEDKSHP